MRELARFTALALAATLGSGCALTDYPAISPVNKSHGIIDCLGSQDRIANTQQTTEPTYRTLYFRDLDVGDGFGPYALSGPVDHATAREWGRFIGPFAALGGVGIRGGGDDGQWEIGGVKDLADGSVRMTTFFSELPADGFPPFSCGFGGPTAVSASEGGVLSQSLPGREPEGAVPGRYLVPETVATDDRPGEQWAENVAATTPGRAFAGYSTMISARERREYHVTATPVTRRGEASLGRFLNGSTETFEGDPGTDLEGWAVSAWGEVTAEGIVAHLTAITAPNGAVYTAGETPVRFVLGRLGSHTVQIESSPTESLLLALFAREAELGDRDIALPEHVDGISLPPVVVRIGADAIERKIDQLTALISGEGGDAPWGG